MDSSVGEIYQIIAVYQTYRVLNRLLPVYVDFYVFSDEV